MKKITILVFLILTFSLNGQTLGKYQIKNLEVNTKLSDFGTNYFGTNKIVFAAPKTGTVIKKVWKGNNQPFLDLYIGNISESGEIINKRKIKGYLKTKFHEAGISFTKDLKTVYFTGNNFYKGRVQKDSVGANNLQLYKADINSLGAWINIVKLPFNGDAFSTGHPALNNDEKKLYFVSDRPSSFGKTDIYVVDIFEDFTYSSPRNVGKTINTSESEMFPFVSKDNVLYFSSEAHNGLGNLDIFASKIYNTTYSSPINIKPLNSVNDDFSFIIDSENRGYFSSNRKYGKGDDDIYYFTASDFIEFKCTSKIYGVVRAKLTNELLQKTIIEILAEDGKVVKKLKTDAIFANYNLDLPCGKKYKLRASHEGYMKKSTFLTTPFDINNSPLEINLFLNKEFKVKEDHLLININPIYFDFNKFNIRPDAAIELDKVVVVMKKYSKIKIEAGSHTDSRGLDSYNLLLSERRAKSTKDYIISRGIEEKRIVYKGYGEKKLVNNCTNNTKCSKEEHQQNRRTEFKIIEN